MDILFPASPIDNKLVDHAFEHEARIAKEEGFTLGRGLCLKNAKPMIFHCT